MAATVLNRPTLVLNRNWQPIGVATVARALVLLWNESARVVCPESFETFEWDDWAKIEPRFGEAFIQAVRFKLRAPEVITLTHYDRLPKATVTFSRRNIYKRDRFVCQYCGCQPGGEELTIDHVAPRSRGGKTTWANCVLACVSCNHRKADRTPEEAGMKLRRKPARPHWRPFYAAHEMRIESWAKFVSESYWNASLDR